MTTTLHSLQLDFARWLYHCRAHDNYKTACAAFSTLFMLCNMYAYPYVVVNALLTSLSILSLRETWRYVPRNVEVFSKLFSHTDKGDLLAVELLSYFYSVSQWFGVDSAWKALQDLTVTHVQHSKVAHGSSPLYTKAGQVFSVMCFAHGTTPDQCSAATADYVFIEAAHHFLLKTIEAGKDTTKKIHRQLQKKILFLAPDLVAICPDRFSSALVNRRAPCLYQRVTDMAALGYTLDEMRSAVKNYVAETASDRPVPAKVHFPDCL